MRNFLDIFETCYHTFVSAAPLNQRKLRTCSLVVGDLRSEIKGYRQKHFYDECTFYGKVKIWKV